MSPHATSSTSATSPAGPAPDYIGWLRSHVGPAEIQLNFAAACVTSPAGQVLLQQRTDSEGWGLPGGAIELGESADDAVLREVREETGLDVTIDHLVGVYTRYRQEYPNGDVAQPITIVFSCHSVDLSLTPDPQESLRLEWVDLHDLPPLWSPLHTDALADFQASHKGVFR